ncbi:SDR family oxidoreductase [Moritella sp. 5]|uniref:UDP-glucose 4-epimerase family protein n=1 Tax=Moritella sp. 5 TaxID=2746231 RepID=UPI001BAAFFB3|nr:SDR family oxidoreductase [Moritella sp. 5]QUM79396.1 SDR family oxidoreductase [Moritella sp. 5]
MTKKFLVTGANGFVGKAVCSFLHNSGYVVQGSVRNRNRQEYWPVNEIADIDSNTDWSKLLTGKDYVIHCAARVHVMNDESSNSLNDYREVNTVGTMNLARQAMESGVKRFIFVSSIKVNGELTRLGKPFTSRDKRTPEDFYAQSKSEAEKQLLELAEQTGLEVVIIRPTLVYGPGVKANFASLINLVSKGLPLPFGCITKNKRSLVSVKNLVDLIITCIDHPNAVNQVFLVSDDNDVSTASMINQMSKALGKSNRIFPMPLWCYYLVGKIFGKQDIVKRLLGSLQVDISHTKETLNWMPPQTLEDGFRETAEAFLNNNKIIKEINK